MPNSRKARKGGKGARGARLKKTGRPEFVPTTKQRREVEIAVFFGRAEEDIARALGISRNTFRKAFAEEIKTGKAKCQFERDVALFNAGISGNVAALKAMVATQATKQDTPTKSQPEHGEKLGKKEQAAMDAKQPPNDPEWGELVGTHTVN